MMMLPLALLLLNVADSDPPIIEDVAAAASNPAAAPVVTVVMSDRGTGVGLAAVIYRSTGTTAWNKAELKGGTSGLFIARLPEGLQKTGFEYYVEATDVAGNGPARIGTPEVPIRVEKATEPTLVRLERQKVADPGPKIHPGWLMLSLGVGMLAGAGAGGFGLDLISTQAELDTQNERLEDPTLTPASRARIEASRDSLEAAVVGDTVIATVLGVVAGAGIVTGGVLVTIASLE